MAFESKIDWGGKLQSFCENNPECSVTEAVYSIILDAIISFQLPPETKLVLLHMAEEMNISMSPVREAVMMLQENGFVTINASRKACVSGYNEQIANNIQSLRISLECLAAEQVCARASDEFISELSRDVEQNIKLWERCKDDFSLYHEQITADLNFHLKLVRGSQNPFLIEQYERIWPNITYVRQFFSPFGFNQAQYPQAHRAIPVALATRDPQFARAAMLMHFKNVFSAKVI